LYLCPLSFFERLIRDIQSLDEKTREYASSILCDFLEFEIEDFNSAVLKTGIEKVISQLKLEKDSSIGQKLAEGIFEFIQSKKLTPKEEIKILERLTEIESYYLYDYLDDEDYLTILKVKKYIELHRDKYS
jgi:hypothetical protein